MAENVTVVKAGGKVAIAFDPAAEGRPSKTSGKNMVIASSGGFVEVPGHPGLRYSINVIRG